MATPASAYLYLLPAEVWLECWQMCSRRQLRRISLVCQLFRSLCLPLLLQSQTFDLLALRQRSNEHNWVENVGHLHRTAVRVDKLLEGPHARLVRSWKVTFDFEHAVKLSLPHSQMNRLLDNLYRRVAKSFSTTIGCYHNLSSLNISNFTFNEGFRSALASLSRLEDLTFWNCKMVARNGFLKLRSLTLAGFSGANSEEPLQLASPGSIHRLDINDTRELGPTIAGFGLAKLSNLVQLSLQHIPASHVTQFFYFLRQCPRLNLLEVQLSQPAASIQPHHVDSDTIPLLRAITAPPFLVRLLAPTRPVNAVVLKLSGNQLTPDDLMLVCSDISRSSAPLHTLSIPRTPLSPELLAAITSLFPDLRDLGIQFWRRRNRRLHRFHRTVDPVIPPIDQQSLDLRDDDAFDDRTAEDISDAEPEPTPIVSVMQDFMAREEMINVSGIHEFVDWIHGGRLSLPPSIEILRLNLNIIPSSSAYFSWEQLQHQAIAALSRLCPLLEEVHFGCSSPPSTSKWTRKSDRGLWISQDGAQRIHVPVA
ncbi:hypothetical protein B0H11DRAFT_2082649 [Mycena galericulata]|nr:hypothetical protein B0H11DRAFT_2082649 [Mycena galericulata]